MKPAPSIALHGAPTSLALSADQKRIVVAGRELLKEIQIGNQNDETNLLQYLRKNINLSSADVAYVPTQHTQIVTGALNGNLLLWDTSRRGSKFARKYDAHSRAINRLCFKPNESKLLTASQDHTVKLWDIGNRNIPLLTFKASAEVRDVQFSRGMPFHFATALESGSVQMFDLRNNRCCLAQWQAHSGPAYALDYHPNDFNLIATGGRDRLIKVWDFEGKVVESPVEGSAATADALQTGLQLKSSIQTVAPVAHLKWMPSSDGGTQYYIASCGAAQHRCKIHIWDAFRSAVPQYSIRGHSDTVVGFEFMPPEPPASYTGHSLHVSSLPSIRACTGLIATSRDGMVAIHDLSLEPPAFSHVSPTAITWAQDGYLLSTHNPQLVKLRDGKYSAQKRFHTTPKHASFQKIIIEPPVLSLPITIPGIDNHPDVESGTHGSLIRMAYDAPASRVKHSSFECMPLQSHRWEEADNQLATENTLVERVARVSKKNGVSPYSNRLRQSTVAALAARRDNPFSITPQLSIDSSILEPSLDIVLPALKDTLQHRAEVADIMGCMRLARCMPADSLDQDKRMLRWLMALTDQMHRAQYFSRAASTIKQFGNCSEMTRKWARQVTGGSLIHIRRDGDRRELGGAQTLCSICELPVKGLYVWCQGCGHGGHMEHMRSWFKGNVDCPAGCGHRCLVAQTRTFDLKRCHATRGKNRNVNSMSALDSAVQLAKIFNG